MRSLQSSLQIREDEMRRSASVAGGLSVVYGKVKILGTGAGIVDLSFPISFVERPVFTFGHELEQGFTSLDVADYPTFSASVFDWDEGKGKQIPLIIGCTVGVRVTGEENSESYMNYQFMGRAMVNPSGSSKRIEANI